MSDLAELDKQVSKLKSDIRTLKWALAVVSLLLLALIICGRRSKSTLEAREFLLRDQAGNVVARLGLDGFENCLSLNSKSRSTAANLCVGEDESTFLSLTEHAGTIRAFLTPGGQLSPMLYIGENDGAKYINLSLEPNPGMTIGHGSNQSVVISSTDAAPSIVLTSPDSKVLWKSPQAK